MKTNQISTNKSRITLKNFACTILLVFAFSQSMIFAQVMGPDDRIAYSADGNAVDPDDWGATPISIAIFAEANLYDQLVHFDYNSRLDTGRNAYKEGENNESTLGAMERFGFNPDIFFDDREDLEGSINSLKNAINASSETSLLWVVMAGPFEVLYRALEAADADKRQYVMMVTHSWVNEQPKRDYDHGRIDCQELGAVYHPVRTGNGCHNAFGGSACNDNNIVKWFDDSSNPDYRWIYSRLEATYEDDGKWDASDATMAYYLAYNDEEGNFVKLKYKFGEGTGSLPPQPYLRITAPINGSKVSMDNNLIIRTEAFDVDGIDRISAIRYSDKWI